MRVKSILNRVEEHKSFVFARVDGETRKGVRCKWKCGHEGQQPSRLFGVWETRPGYDTLLGREFEFVPLWGIPVCYLYALRRVQCQGCGVKVERVPWAEGKQTLTRSYMQFLATWAQRLSWLEVARFFHTSWEKVFRSVSWVVQWGLAHRDLSGIQAPGHR